MIASSVSLPQECRIRQASEQDIKSIRKLVWSAKLDPTQLRWEQFWVIECDGKLAACGQLRKFTGAQELGSLVVAKDWRDRGLGSYLTQYLIQQATKPLYLECLGKRLASFYSRFGFLEVPVEDLPQSLKFKFGLSQLAKILFRVPVTIMQYQESF
ncbi:GNAT family N-acetyltransferase [Microcoleus sp. LEGE 07076]|uniref:GNAT family N-acetyltransferase n=1 Tax=Microcoleus sp. LEGE 07076 TaxID=915322 RepID=UPI00187FC314|nr:GNAT family N-acetyltransferase [Microcoleus sp. LEGE 07076]MBE9184854.1 GNAT family N-acetyltransferase [Microcoleus sp. LEGE 07076]